MWVVVVERRAPEKAIMMVYVTPVIVRMVVVEQKVHILECIMLAWVAVVAGWC